MKLSDATAARPLWTLTNATLALDCRFIRLVDEETDDLAAMDAVGELTEQNWVLAGDGWICARSGGTGHRPVITLEAWETAPARTDERWDQEHDLRVVFPSGTVWLSGGTDGGTEGPHMVMPTSDGERYNVRVRRRSAEDGKTVDELYDEAQEAGWAAEEPLYIEFWQIQFWPA